MEEERRAHLARADRAQIAKLQVVSPGHGSWVLGLEAGGATGSWVLGSARGLGLGSWVLGPPEAGFFRL